jgi:hypothetical protein
MARRKRKGYGRINGVLQWLIHAIRCPLISEGCYSRNFAGVEKTLIDAGGRLARSTILPKGKIEDARRCDRAPFQFAKWTSIDPAELRNKIDIERSAEPVRNGMPAMIGLPGTQRSPLHARRVAISADPPAADAPCGDQAFLSDVEQIGEACGRPLHDVVAQSVAGPKPDVDQCGDHAHRKDLRRIRRSRDFDLRIDADVVRPCRMPWCETPWYETPWRDVCRSAYQMRRAPPVRNSTQDIISSGTRPQPFLGALGTTRSQVVDNRVCPSLSFCNY